MTDTPQKFAFPELTKSLDSWGHFLVDSPVGTFLRKRIRASLVQAYPTTINYPLEADLVCFMSAVYAGGYEAGKNSVPEPEGVKSTTLYRAFQVHDEHERHKSLIGIYTTNAAAEKAIKGRGWFGSDGSVIKGDAYFVGDRIIFPQEMIYASDLDVNLPEREREKKTAALAKLTPEEQLLLGLVK